MSEEENATLTILRTSDASKTEIPFSLSQSLNELKSAIATSSLGPVSPSYQRLFHLGRELKSGGRTLAALGVGRFHNFSLHLHSTQPATCDLLSSDDEKEEEVEIVKEPPVATQTNKRAVSKTEVIDLLDDSDDEQEANKRQRVS